MQNATMSPRSKLEHAFRHALFCGYQPDPVRSGTNPSLTQSSPTRMKKQVMRHTYRRTRHRIGPKAAIARTGKQLPANARRKHVPWPIRHSKSPGAEAHGALCSTRSTGAFCHSDPHCGPKPEYPPGDYLCTVNQRPEIDGSTLSTSCPSATSVLIVFFPSFTTGFFLPPAKGSVTRPVPRRAPRSPSRRPKTERKRSATPAAR